MSNLNKKEKIASNIKKTLKKNEDKKAICKEHHINLWLILFFPVGIYKSFKYKGHSIFFNICFSFFSIFLVMFLILYIRNPYGLTNLSVKNSIENFEDYGKIYDYVFLGEMDDFYLVYETYTESGIYNLWLNKEKKHKIEYVKRSITPEVFKNTTTCYSDSYNLLFPEIMLFLNQEDNQKKFGKFSYVNTQLNTDIVSDLDLTYQAVHTSKGIYIFGCIYNQVVQVLDENKEILYQRKPEILFPQKIKQLISKNTKKIGAIDFIYQVSVDTNGLNYFFVNKDDIHFKITETISGELKVFKATNSSELEEKAYKYIHSFETIN